MGELEVMAGLTGEARRGFMKAVLRDLRALEEILHSGLIENSVRRVGAEQEFFLVDHAGRPALAALEVLANADDPHFTTELGRFNLEINLDPMEFEGRVLHNLEVHLQEMIGKARRAAEAAGVDIALVGILPSIRKSDLGLNAMTPRSRYKALNRALCAMRDGPYDFNIMGVDELNITHDNVMLEACNCSWQLHFQVGSSEFANLYNIAQAVAAPVLAAATNSPMLFGRRLWSETRIALFQQSIDTRATTENLHDRRPRVTFGTSWVKDSVIELFREDIARFRAVFGSDGEEDPLAMLKRGVVPDLQSLRLHNGTVYRWNRACYGVKNNTPHLRIENRILPSGPTVRDEIANAALLFGLISGLSHKYDDISQHLCFQSAKGNFRQAARYGLSAQFEWLEERTVPAQKLLLEELLPLAESGLRDKDVASEDISLYLGVIADRVRNNATGAHWMTRSLTRMHDAYSNTHKLGALTLAMVARQKEDKPVSEWEPARIEEAGDWKHSFMRVEQVMTTDLFTVQEDEPLELVAQLMDWEKIRHVPVEDASHRLVGLMSYRTVLRALCHGSIEKGLSQPVSDVMRKDLITVSPNTTTFEAMRLLREHRIGCLPVLKDRNLVGIVTERDFMTVAGSLMADQLSEFIEQEEAGRMAAAARASSKLKSTKHKPDDLEDDEADAADEATEAADEPAEATAPSTPEVAAPPES